MNGNITVFKEVKGKSTNKKTPITLSNNYLPKKLDIILDIKLIKMKDKTTTDNKKSPH